MPGLPEITMVGTLTSDPELRFTASGAAVANFTVANNDRRYDKAEGKYVDGDATFVRCSVWKEAAENVAESLARGQRVIVRGELSQRSYETREGEKRTVFECKVSEVGPSLRWATVKVSKAARGGGSPAPSDDPWSGAQSSTDIPF